MPIGPIRGTNVATKAGGGDFLLTLPLLSSLPKCSNTLKRSSLTPRLMTGPSHSGTKLPEFPLSHAWVPVTREELCEEVGKMKKNVSVGPDGVNVGLLVHLLYNPVLGPQLVDLVNHISSGKMSRSMSGGCLSWPCSPSARRRLNRKTSARYACPLHLGS